MNDDEILKMFRRIDGKLDRIQATLNERLHEVEHRLADAEYKIEALIETR